ncbi:MAG TPA: biopolymer transporter ExbD [Saprospiraceae bacterium]|jgi:biopolymer transport protein ExbD|nr:biopolymer transporter ExbD [Saprospiraceae bacterium]HMP14538.1 biopolymer transporter ExbD [Saprospiraceae bacterium]
MALKKRNKTSAEFSMASLTDVIFLLLIFFMLSSKLVTIEPFELPKSDSKTVAPTNIVVSINNEGVHKLNGKELSPKVLERALQQEVTNLKDTKDLTVTIVAQVGTPFDYVADVMEVAAKMRARAIIATQPTS